MTEWRKNSAAYLESRIDGETLLITMDEGRILSLEGTGRAIWEQLDCAAEEDALAKALTQIFAGPPESIEEDVRQFCRRLEQHGLLVPV